MNVCTSVYVQGWTANRVSTLSLLLKNFNYPLYSTTTLIWAYHASTYTRRFLGFPPTTSPIEVTTNNYSSSITLKSESETPRSLAIIQFLSISLFFNHPFKMDLQETPVFRFQKIKKARYGTELSLHVGFADDAPASYSTAGKIMSSCSWLPLLCC
jgi:hypothetical protein